MEHLMRPANSKIMDTDVPYICDEPEPYDGGLFSEYPVRKGRLWMVYTGTDKEEDLPPALLPVSQSMPTHDQESFFQAWMFFGLLKTVLGDRYDSKAFIDRRQSGSFVTTKELLPRLAESRDSRLENGTADKQTQYNNLERCLRLINFNIVTTKSDFDTRIKLSIASTAEIIATAAYTELHTTSVPIPLTSCYAEYPDENTAELMIQRDWCPSEIVAVRAKFGSLLTRFFLSRLEKKSLDGVRKKHSGCTEQKCESFQIDPQDYCTKHQCKQKTCDMVTIDGKALQSTLTEGRLPLLEIKDSGELSIIATAVEEEEPGTAYTAISHLWADGLGNPMDNSLPRCQLERIRDLAAVLNLDPSTAKREADRPYREGSTEKLDSFSESRPDVAELQKTDQMLFWVDTLCCPVSPDQGKGLALERMAETYSKAKHVLALDAELQLIDQQQIPPYEALLRVFSSAWVQRLWTLQEGALAQRLWIQFGDGPVEVSVLFAQLQKDMTTDIRIYCIGLDLISQWRWLNITHLLEPKGQPATIGFMMTILDRALAHRSTSVAADEPLCIANLVKISIAQVLKAGDQVEVRMAKVWELIAKKYEGIPQEILFLSYTRLTVKGFQWAPKTLLRGTSEEKVDTRMARWMTQNVGRLSKEGFEITAPGFMVARRVWDNGYTFHLSDPRGESNLGGLIPIQDQNGAWFGIAVRGHLASFNEGKPPGFPFQGQWAVLLPREKWWHGTENHSSSEAILGKVEINGNGKFYMDSMTQVILFRLPVLTTLYDAVFLSVKELNADQLNARFGDLCIRGTAQGDLTDVQPGIIYPEQLESKIEAAVEKSLQDETLMETIIKQWPDKDGHDVVLKWVKGWFEHDLVVARAGPDHQWCLG